jgi:hypothetical protein
VLLLRILNCVNYSQVNQSMLLTCSVLAEELRRIMADLGFRTINEMVGRIQFLKVRDNIKSWKAKKIDLSGMLHPLPTIRV